MEMWSGARARVRVHTHAGSLACSIDKSKTRSISQMDCLPSTRELDRLPANVNLQLQLKFIGSPISVAYKFCVLSILFVFHVQHSVCVCVFVLFPWNFICMLWLCMFYAVQKVQIKHDSLCTIGSSIQPTLSCSITWINGNVCQTIAWTMTLFHWQKRNPCTLNV